MVVTNWLKRGALHHSYVTATLSRTCEYFLLPATKTDKTDELRNPLSHTNYIIIENRKYWMNMATCGSRPVEHHECEQLI